MGSGQTREKSAENNARTREIRENVNCENSESATLFSLVGVAQSGIKKLDEIRRSGPTCVIEAPQVQSQLIDVVLRPMRKEVRYAVESFHEVVDVFRAGVWIESQVPGMDKCSM